MHVPSPFPRFLPGLLIAIAAFVPADAQEPAIPAGGGVKAPAFIARPVPLRLNNTPLIGATPTTGAGTHTPPSPVRPKPGPSADEVSVITTDETPNFRPAHPAHPATSQQTTLNDWIVAMVKRMPMGGHYSTRSEAAAGLRKAVQMDDNGHFLLQQEMAKPTFCSGATYLVLLSLLDHLNREGWLPLSKEAVSAMLVKSQSDGTGVWGRWNANGPGTARLFFELGLGRSFTSFEDALPGDFMKIFWNENIGSTEKGHSVIYLSSTPGEDGEMMIKFWSANSPEGFGIKTVPRSRIRRALFSRLENLRAIERVTSLPPTDSFLAGMLKHSCTEAEMFEMIGLDPATARVSAPVARADVRGAPAEGTSRKPRVLGDDFPMTVTTPERTKPKEKGSPSPTPTPKPEKKSLLKRFIDK